jgi:arylsulfatase A
MKLKKIAITLIVLILLAYDTFAQNSKKPNILFVLIDDMGYPAIESYGNQLVPTPNVDALAEKGMRFTQGYVAPQCTPTRATLLTGQYTARNKMWHVIPQYGFPNARVKEPVYLEDLPREQFTVAEALKTAGYTTAILGKWHLSAYENDGYYTYLYPDKAHYYGFDYVNPKQDPSEYQAYGDKGVDFLTDEAIGFMEKNKNHPFFIYLSHHTVHGPILAPKDLVQKYLDKGFPEKGLNSAEYLACIEHLDNSIGRLLQKIEELDIEKNTVVFFVSDNGGVDSEFDNAPLRNGKGSAYEGGTRVPFIVKWPDKIHSQEINKTPVHIVDVYPTLMEIAGISQPKNQVLDGVSLLPLLKSNKNAVRKLAQRPIYFYQPLYDIQWGAVPCASMVQGDYKLIWFFGDYIDLDQNGKYIPEGRIELYNLTKDLGETTDISAAESKIANKMQEQLKTWILSCDAEIPGLNPDFDIEKWDVRKKNKKEE